MLARINRRAKKEYDKRENAEKDTKALNHLVTSKQDDLLTNKDIEGYIDEKTKYEILRRCYGLVTREVMRPRSCFRLPFSFKLPSPHVVVKKIIRNGKFGKILEEYSRDIPDGSIDDMEKEDCCKRCCFPRREYKSQAEAKLEKDLAKAKKDLAAMKLRAEAAEQKSSKKTRHEAAPPAPPASSSSEGAPPAAEDLV